MNKSSAHHNNSIYLIIYIHFVESYYIENIQARFLYVEVCNMHR